MSGSATIVPTPGQQKAIDARGQNILVNAGAGAGKTSTLTKRVVGRLLDPQAPLKLDQLVIVTFTRAAAAEMRDRIGKALREERDKLGESNASLTQRLDAEIQSLPRARISTLHSYCGDLLREFGDRVKVPPDFDLIDDDEAMLIHHEMVRQEIEAIAGDKVDGPILRHILQQISPTMGGSEIEALAVRLQHFLESLDDPDDFVHRAMQDYDVIERGGDFRQTKWYDLLASQYMDDAAEFRSAFEEYLDDIQGLALTGKSQINVRDTLRERVVQLQRIETERDLDGYLALRNMEGFFPRRGVTSKSSTPDDVEAHRLSDILKKNRVDKLMKAGKSLLEMGALEEIAQSIKATSPFLRLFLGRLGLGMNKKLQETHIGMKRLRFSDLERLTLKVLEGDDRMPTDAANAVRDRTVEILVDEFQDVNGLQARLLEAIARPADGGGNLFVVGDLKQSIYGFRQADPRKFKERYNSFAPYDPDRPSLPGARIDLVDNYRSLPSLLGLFNSFFRGLFSERIGSLTFDASHQFVAGNKPWNNPLPPPYIDLLLLDKSTDEETAEEADGAAKEEPESTDSGEEECDESLEQFEEEARAVAGEILRLRDEGSQFGDIAILTRSGSAAATKLVEVFQHVGIPYHTEASTGFLQQQEVLDFKALLRVLNNPCEDVALVGVLRGPVAEWSEDELLQLRLVHRYAPLIENLHQLAGEASGELTLKAVQALRTLDRWREASRRRPMGELFAMILEETDWCARVESLPNGDMRVSNLLYLVERAVQFDGFQRKGLAQFLFFLEQLEQNDRDLGSPPAAPPSADVVRIMTIHKSKGLEFPVVILPFLGTRMNQADLKNALIWERDTGIATRYQPNQKWGDDTKSASVELLKPIIREKLLSEELRLLYVAMTRAEQRLVMIGSWKPSKMTLREAIIAKVSRYYKGGDAWRLREAARATMPLDWVILGFLDQPAMATQSSDAIPTPADLRVRIMPSANAGKNLKSGQEPLEERARRAEETLRAHAASIQAMIARINVLSSAAEAKPIKVKVTATEAKRAWQQEQLLDEGDVPHRWTPRAPRDPKMLPEWWPGSLKPDHVTGGKQRGNINHKFIENLDLEKYAAGATLEEEAERMVHDGILDCQDVLELLLREVRDILELEPLGPELIAQRHTIRRELPFRIGVPVRDLVKDPTLPDEMVMLQGVIDLVYENKHGELVIVDWKTDRWDGSAERIDELTIGYRPQILLYMEGLRRATNRKVARGWLVFLQAGQPVSVQDESDGDAWLEILKPAVAFKG